MTDALIRAASSYFRASVEDIKGPRRVRHMVKVRAAIAIVMRHRDGMSFPLIGQRLGGRDHTTIINCINQGWEWMWRDEAFGRFVDAQLCLPRYSRDAATVPSPFSPGQPIAKPRPHTPCPAHLVKLRPKPVCEVVIAANRRFSLDEDGFSREDRFSRKDVARGSRDLVAALRREHPERCAA